MVITRNCVLVVLWMMISSWKWTKFANCETHNVGDALTWTVAPSYNYTEWARLKGAKVGDSLLFVYSKASHDVRRVTAEQYEKCDMEEYLELWHTGEDRVVLNSTGVWYFLCSYPQHCELGQRLSIEVAPAATVPASSPPPGPPRDSPPSEEKDASFSSRLRPWVPVCLLLAPLLVFL